MKRIFCIFFVFIILCSLSSCKKDESNVLIDPLTGKELKEGQPIYEDKTGRQMFYRDLNKDEIKIAYESWSAVSKEDNVEIDETFISAKEKRVYCGLTDKTSYYIISSFNDKEYVELVHDGDIQKYIVQDPDRDLVSSVKKETYGNEMWSSIFQSESMTFINYEGSLVYNGQICDIISFYNKEIVENPERTYVDYTVEFVFDNRHYSVLYEEDKDGIYVYGECPEELMPSDTCEWDLNSSIIRAKDTVVIVNVVDIFDYGFLNTTGFEPTVNEIYYVLCIEPETRQIYKAEIHKDNTVIEITYSDNLLFERCDATESIDLETVTQSLYQLVNDMYS